MRLAAIQIAIDDGEERDARHERGRALAMGCRGADLLLFPETWGTGYFSFGRYEAEAETLEGPFVSAMADLARDLGAYVHLGSFVERTPDGALANTSVLFGRRGERLAVYRKMHLFGVASEERRLLAPGTEVVTAATEFGTVGLATCYDLRFPEFFRCMADRGTDLFLVCSAWPSSRLEHWLLFNRVRALENLAFLVSANCAGTSRGQPFCGHSQVVDPWGTVVARAGGDEVVVQADIDLATAAEFRQEFPFLRDRTLSSPPV